jgi:hypothetical protein
VTDSATLAAAWRERVAAGYDGPVSVKLTGRGHGVMLDRNGVHTLVATYPAKYKAHAHAEQVARKLYNMTRQDTTS